MNCLRWGTVGVLIASAVLSSCGQRDAALTPVETRFTEVAQEVGMRFVHRQIDGDMDLICESMGSGLAWLDFDNDGDWDLYVVNGKGYPSALYRNDGGRFTDVAEAAGVTGFGWGMGVTAANYDGDGWTDLFVTHFEEPAKLYRNRGNGTFEDVAAKAGVAGWGWEASSAWGDVDGDGDLDLYVVRYLDFNSPAAAIAHDGSGRPELHTLVPDNYPPQANSLYINNGDGTFTDATARAGVANPDGRGLGAIFCDYDHDGDLDLYVANDNTPNVFYRNRGDGTFENVSFATGTEDSRGSMGLSFGDIDGDGDLDLFVTNWQMETNALYRNNQIAPAGRKSSDTFDDATLESGLGPPSMGLTGWGTHLADFDNDGDPDIYVANGYTSPSETDKSCCEGQRSQFFRNEGGRFTELRDAFAVAPWGAGRGSAVADYDGDGDLDIAVSQNNGRLLLFRNDTGHEQSAVRIQAPPGARVEVRVGKRARVAQVTAGSSYMSSSAPELVIGTPHGKRIDRIEVRYPGGSVETATRVPVDSRIRFIGGKEPEMLANAQR